MQTMCDIETDAQGAAAIEDALADQPAAAGWTVRLSLTDRAYRCRITVPGDWAQEAIVRSVLGAMLALAIKRGAA